MAAAEESPAVAQWLAQVAAMKVAIADLKLPDAKGPDDLLHWDDEDSDFSYSPESSSHDVWDFISDTELEELGLDSGDLMDGTDGLANDVPFDSEWFVMRCSQEAARKNGLPSSNLQDQLMVVLKSSRPANEL